jgi:hypothetical protein
MLPCPITVSIRSPRKKKNFREVRWRILHTREALDANDVASRADSEANRELAARARAARFALYVRVARSSIT